MKTFIEAVKWTRLIFWKPSPNIFSSRKLRRKYVLKYLEIL